MPKMNQMQELYIKENINKLDIAELVKVTGLTARTIGNFAKKLLKETENKVESQHDTSTVPAKKQKSEALKRMTSTKGVTIMTEEMSARGDERKSVKRTKELGKSIHRIYDE